MPGGWIVFVVCAMPRGPLRKLNQTFGMRRERASLFMKITRLRDPHFVVVVVDPVLDDDVFEGRVIIMMMIRRYTTTVSLMVLMKKSAMVILGLFLSATILAPKLHDF